MKQIFANITFKSAYGIIYIVSLAPMPVLYAVSSFFYVLVYYVFGYRKAVVIQNISRSFPEKKYEEIRCIVKKFYACFTVYFAEIIKSISIAPHKLDGKIIFENTELIDTHIAGRRNVIACLGHCGNWELLNYMPYKLSHDMHAVYKPLRCKTIDRLMLRLRSRFGMNLIPDKSIVRHILTNSTSQAVYLFLADQCPLKNEDKYKFNLLNQTTYLFSGMEKLARISKSAVIYLHITQLSKGNYKITCLPVCAEAESADEGQITRKYADLLTENIKEEPYSWLWTHKRWKR